MPRKMLSPEIISLIHHVELNKSGWWRKAIGQVVRGVLWKARKPMNLAEVSAALKVELSMQLSDDVLTRQLDSLESLGSVTRMPESKFKLSEQALNELAKAHQQAVSEQESCKEMFLKTCSDQCPHLDRDKVWEKFSTSLAKAIQVAGANLYHLLADGNLERDVDWFSDFLSGFAPDDRVGLRLVLSGFFAPENKDCRSQVLRLLSAHFFAEASQLRPETLRLIEAEKKVRSIKVVLDTNFIFSVLGLHDNPGDDSALSLIEIAKTSRKNFEVRFYVLPSTLDEAQRVLVKQLSLVERIRTTRVMANAALAQPLPGVAKKFFDAASRSPGLTATSFFQPYIDDLRTILLDKGIAVLDAHPTIYHQRQDVIDDVLDEQSREEAEIPEARRKGYATLLHDAVLWHAVMDRRETGADSPFDVEYWAVSIDWRLIAFDRKKRSSNASRLPVVLHPSNLVQLVQFWVPRSVELEESLVDSLRLPMFFQTFDPADERATVKVLEVLSRYENIGDMPEQTLKKVLANQALRGRLRDADASNDEVLELIREELLAEHQQTLTQLEATKGALHGAQTSLETERRTRQISEDELRTKSKEVAAAEAKALAAEQAAELLAKERQDFEDREDRVRKEKEAVEAELKAQKAATELADRGFQRLRYALIFFVAPAIIGAVLAVPIHGMLAEYLPALAGGWKKLAIVCGVGLIPIAFSCLLSPLYTDQRKHLSDWWPCRLAKRLKGAILAPLGITASAIYQGGAWDWVKAVTGFNP